MNIYLKFQINSEKNKFCFFIAVRYEVNEKKRVVSFLETTPFHSFI